MIRLNTLWIATLALGSPATTQANRTDDLPRAETSAAPSSGLAIVQNTPPTSGAIFNAARPYVALTDGHRAADVGDLVTIVLAERTQGSVTNSSALDRNGSLGLAPPTSGPLSIFSASDAALGGNTSFAGSGRSIQGNALSGEVTARVIEVLPGGQLRVEGTKHIRINRGNETVRVTGIARLTDIGRDNRILSTRLADPDIDYTGRGEIARASRQGWLQRFFTRISPF